jgi:hypothetical protein
MRSKNPNIEMLETAALDLKPLIHDTVFLGGAATGLLLTDPAAPPIRITYDIDVIIEVASLSAYHQFNEKLRKIGFLEDISPDAPICRWKKQNIILDVMPTNPEILGFGNRWFSKAFSSAVPYHLPSGQQINVLPAPFFLATKIEAFKHRGNNDYILSTDMEDIVTVIDGRSEIIEEVVRSVNDLKIYLNEFLSFIRNNPAFYESLPGHLPPDKASQARFTQILQRIEKMIELTN